ncbi:hypothetical protein BGZ58_002081 [Dissophora ornata]|nr:hypothetical protein BGZ58_002081 [Dissophora ornata]
MSIPIQKSEPKSESVANSLVEFLAENAATQQSTGGGSVINDEGWHEGYLDEVYKSVAEKRKQAFSKDPHQRRRRSRPDSDTKDQGTERGRGNNPRGKGSPVSDKIDIQIQIEICVQFKEKVSIVQALTVAFLVEISLAFEE